MSLPRRVAVAFVALLGVVASPDPLDRLRRQLLYRAGTEVELNMVLTIPLNDPVYSVSLGLFLEGNYDLPPYNSQAIYTQPWQKLEEKRQRRSASRAAVYRAVEGLLERVGRLPGRVCLLRSICEAASAPFHHDGLIGQLIHAILTPSTTSENGPLHLDYIAAEQLGRSGSVCGQYFASCPATPLDLMSTLSTLALPDYF